MIPSEEIIRWHVVSSGLWAALLVLMAGGFAYVARQADIKFNRAVNCPNVREDKLVPITLGMLCAMFMVLVCSFGALVNGIAVIKGYAAPNMIVAAAQPAVSATGQTPAQQQ